MVKPVAHESLPPRRRGLSGLSRTGFSLKARMTSLAGRTVPNLSVYEVNPHDATNLTRGGELARAFFGHRGRLAYKWVHYLDAYDHHFAQYRGKPVRLLEIGVWQGGSLQIWRQYFGANAVIYGVDVDPHCASVDDPGINVRIGSQADRQFLKSVVAEMGGVDIIIDDGSHKAKDHSASFDTLFPTLSDGGLYVVEDLHTAYWHSYGGGLRRSGSFIERTKDLIDGMHAWYYPRHVSTQAQVAKTEIGSICIHDSIVFIEKFRHGRPVVTKVGQVSL